MHKKKVSNLFYDNKSLISFNVHTGRLVNEYIGIPLVVKNKIIKKIKRNNQYEEDELEGSTIVHEVKRVGLLIDRYVDLELRVGDQLILYISKSQA